MHGMGRFLGAVAVSLALLIPTGTRAASFTLGDGMLGPGDHGLFGAAPGAGPISDTFGFQAISAAQIGVIAASIEIFHHAIDGLIVALYQDNGAPGVSSDDDMKASSVPIAPGGDVVLLAYSNLQSGLHYYLEVFGTAVGSKGGLYIGAYNLSAVPVPPTVWLLASALVGLVGIARRRCRGGNYE